jgi:hypothetical protein
LESINLKYILLGIAIGIGWQLWRAHQKKRGLANRFGGAVLHRKVRVRRVEPWNEEIPDADGTFYVNEGKLWFSPSATGSLITRDIWAEMPLVESEPGWIRMSHSEAAFEVELAHEARQLSMEVSGVRDALGSGSAG